MYKENIELQKSYILYSIGDELFASDSNEVRNIFDAKFLFNSNNTKCLKKFLYYGGDSIQIVNLREQFGMSSVKCSKKTCLLILKPYQNSNQKAAFIVDDVKSLINIEKDDLMEKPRIGNKYRSDFIDKIVKVNDEIVRIINIRNLINADSKIVEKQFKVKSKLVLNA